MSLFHAIAVAAGLLATTASTLSVYPHQLAYFNELAGGPENGHRHLLHSNLDWGQDLYFLLEWASDNPDMRPLYLLYRGFASPNAMVIECADWKDFADRSSPLNSVKITTSLLSSLPSGWCAVSAQFVYGFGGAAYGGNQVSLLVEFGAIPEFLLLRDHKMIVCGYSIVVFPIRSPAHR